MDTYMLSFVDETIARPIYNERSSAVVGKLIDPPWTVLRFLFVRRLISYQTARRITYPYVTLSL